MTIFIPYLDEEVIEQDAYDLLAEYARSARVRIAPPIPIEDIVEKHLKLLLEFDDTHRLFGIPRVPESAPDILGAMFFDSARVVIDESLDPDVNPAKEGRYRFTLAHEGGGHWRLHREIFTANSEQSTLVNDPVMPAVVCRSSQSKERVEWQADYYASCLLMPSHLLFDAWRKRFGTYDPFIFDPLKHTSMAHRRLSNGPHLIGNFMKEIFQPDCDSYFDQSAKQFAQIFRVSTLAMRIRLEKLELLISEDPNQQILDDGV